MTHNEKIQTAIDSINDLEISRQDKDRLIQQIKAAVPNEEDFLSQCQSLIQGMNRYDASAMNRTSVRIGTAQGKPCVFVWYVNEGSSTTLATLFYATWENVFKALDNGDFKKRVGAILNGDRGPEFVRAIRMEERPLDVVEVIQALAMTHLGTGTRVLAI